MGRPVLYIDTTTLPATTGLFQWLPLVWRVDECSCHSTLEFMPFSFIIRRDIRNVFFFMVFMGSLLYILKNGQMYVVARLARWSVLDHWPIGRRHIVKAVDNVGRCWRVWCEMKHAHAQQWAKFKRWIVRGIDIFLSCFVKGCSTHICIHCHTQTLVWSLHAQFACLLWLVPLVHVYIERLKLFIDIA